VDNSLSRLIESFFQSFLDVPLYLRRRGAVSLESANGLRRPFFVVHARPACVLVIQRVGYGKR